jgi:hypothetical protein
MTAQLPELCPKCLDRNIIAPVNGPTCSHNSFKWPRWKEYPFLREKEKKPKND